jgi:DNA-3-methyladenine glycosylase II
MEGTLSAEARALAASDPAMAALVVRVGPLAIEDRRRDGTPFEALARIVVGQQVSTAAARTIWERICSAFGGAPHHSAVLDAEERLRACGMSGRKASYVCGIARAIAERRLDPEALASMEDEGVIEALTEVRGLGRWSAEMFLIFHLGRPDVFSGGDLGLRNGLRIMLGAERAPGPAEAISLAERWRPRRSLASLYLWEAVRLEAEAANSAAPCSS